MRQYTFWITLLTGLISSSAFSQTGSISGNLVYLENSNVYRSGSSEVFLYQYGIQLLSAYTNERGEFEFKDVQSGEYSVIAYFKVQLKTGKGTAADQILGELISSYTKSEEKVIVYSNKRSFVRVKLGSTPNRY